MAKYKLISRYGNEICETDSERKRDELLRLGFRVCEDKNHKTESKAGVKKKALADKG